MLRSLLSVAVVTLFGCTLALAEEAPAGVPEQTKCPEQLDKFESGGASADFVVKCIGKPVSEDHNPDGRFVYLYKLKDGITITYLFDSKGLLLRHRVYQVKE
jgi:hypothetical protein